MKKRAGFTLLEVIVTLAIAGIMAAVAGIAVVSGVNAYLMAKNNTAISQKAQLAMARISRELIELTDVTGTAADSVIYQNTQGSRAIARVGNYIKILDGSALPTPDTGDILTDNVQTFTIQHYKGSQLWVQGADNIQLLSAIIVSLVLRHPTAGSSLTFSTTINPRNNQNVGGSPAPQPDQLAYKPSGCFIATAAYGNPNHPVVVLLKQFRDRYLLTWDGGRKVVNAYYSISPYIADAIRNHLWACSLTRMLIFPFAAIAFLLIYAPVSILLLMISSFLLLNIFIRYLKSSRHKNIPRAYGNKGTILVGLIVTITILATLGAAMLSLFSTSTFSQLSGNNAQKAYYLAESGYRYAASKFLNTSGEAAKSSALESMHNQTFSLGTDGSFQLKVYPYWYQTVSDNAVGT
ncbi:MAG TPA: hypothetical protein DD641_02655, partial [Deltaproteobacteria bacterium]|nr:hypothetical protein [Deltaproteobacteria bacterium]